MAMNVRDIAMRDARTQTKKSVEWYTKMVRTPMEGMSVQKFLGDNQPHQAKTIMPGQMVHFFYSPKNKDDRTKLPFYDTFPLLLPFPISPEMTKKKPMITNSTHFIGLNLHYIHPKMRMVLLSKLMTFIDDDSLPAKAKLNLSWRTISSVSMMPQAQQCVKLYLKKHVKSNFIIVPPKEWDMVVWLPSERFKNASAEEVWGKK